MVEPIPGPSTQVATSSQTTTSSQANSTIIIDSSDSDHKNISEKIWSNWDEKVNSRRS